MNLSPESGPLKVLDALFVCYCFHVSLAYIGIFRFQCSAITVAHKVQVPFLITEYLEDVLHSFNMTALIFDSFV